MLQYFKKMIRLIINKQEEYFVTYIIENSGSREKRVVCDVQFIGKVSKLRLLMFLLNK
mgnify:FL=1